MAALSPTSAAAIARLRSFVSPPTQYHSLPLARRAAVLILLFADRKGDLRVVLTIRSAKLKNYSGHAALPGGKADFEKETPFMTARREAFEEIGLPLSDDKLPAGYTVEHLTELPANLAVTELGVRPCVAWLKAPTRNDGSASRNVDPARDLLPKLDAKEVAAVFTAPFHNFLRSRDEERGKEAPPGEWYKGSWISWHEENWRMHQFHVPVTPSSVFLAKNAPKSVREDPTAANEDAELPQSEGEKQTAEALRQRRYRVFGMTARILVDAARVAYGEDPDFEHNSSFGDEEMIEKLRRIGRLSPVKKEGEKLTREVMQKAKLS